MRDNLFLLAATLLWGFWGIANKQAIARAHPLTVQWMYSLPHLIFIPICFYLSYKISSEKAFLPDLGTLGWALAGSIASIAAVLLLFFAMQNKPASLAVTITAAYPVVTLALGVLSGSEALSLPKAIGILLIVAGVVVLQYA